MQAVFHLSDDDSDLHDQLLGNIENLLDDDTIALDDIALLANSGGIEVMLKPSLHDNRLRQLIDRGLVCKTCQNTIDGSDIDPEDLLDSVDVVPSVMGELVRLQEAGYAYIRP